MDQKPLKILVVDDNRSSAQALTKLLCKQGDDATAVYDGSTAIELIQADPPDVVLTDLKMEPVGGMAVLEAAREQRPPVETIVFTGFGAVDVAVRAMRMGARDFLTKPVTVDQVTLRLDQLRGGPETSAPEGAFPFVAESEESRMLLSMLRRAAVAPSPTWIEGEIGTGRGYAAQALHRFGHPSDPDAPLTIRDLGQDEPWPERGTVVLPNVDDLPDDLQRRLVRSLRYLPKEVRTVATACMQGKPNLEAGTLRAELYYALAVVVIRVPPLRRRPEDIKPLFEHALQLFADRYGRPVPRITDQDHDDLKRHSWPGNVRELFNLAERTVVMGTEAFGIDIVEETSSGLPTLEPGFSLSAYLESVERALLVDALRRSNGDRAEAGRLLGVERNTLRYKLNKYGLLER